jgi:hypothetical protein
LVGKRTRTGWSDSTSCLPVSIKMVGRFGCRNGFVQRLLMFSELNSGRRKDVSWNRVL